MFNSSLNRGNKTKHHKTKGDLNNLSNVIAGKWQSQKLNISSVASGHQAILPITSCVVGIKRALTKYLLSEF